MQNIVQYGQKRRLPSVHLLAVIALALSQGLAAAEAAVAAGERDTAALCALARAPLAAAPDARIDYVELRDADDLTALPRLDRPGVLAIAAFLGTTRLIDNRVLSPTT